VWSKPYGLYALGKVVFYNNDLIVLNKYSKVFGLDSKSGKVKWERAAIGYIGDLYLTKRETVALIIDSADNMKTRIVE
jgi:hypothetical protein